jgi:hypothetical protein
MQKSIAGSQGTNETEKSNNRQMAKLLAWWNAQPYPRRLERPISAPDRLQKTQFENPDALTPYVERRINLTLDRFRAYFSRLGFSPKTGSIKVRISTNKDDIPNAYYEPGKNTIVLDWRLTKDNDVVLREYAHHVLIGEVKSDDWWHNLGGLESGLADYFACSFKGDPEFGVNFVSEARKANLTISFPNPYLRTMDNRRQFMNELELHDEGEVWGGAFWELRESMGRDEQHNHRADVLLLKTVQHLEHPPPRAKAREAIVSQILEEDRQLYQGQHAAKIRAVFAQRGLKPAPPPSPLRSK